MNPNKYSQPENIKHNGCLQMKDPVGRKQNEKNPATSEEKVKLALVIDAKADIDNKLLPIHSLLLQQRTMLQTKKVSNQYILTIQSQQ